MAMATLPGPDRLAQWVRTPFEVHGPEGGPVTLVLDSVEVLAAPAGFEAYSIMFLGPEAAPLEQSTHHLVAEGIEPIDLFLVPVALDAAGYRYQAIVNRRVEPDEIGANASADGPSGREES
jgi:hypothetical protein